MNGDDTYGTKMSSRSVKEKTTLTGGEPSRLSEGGEKFWVRFTGGKIPRKVRVGHLMCEDGHRVCTEKSREPAPFKTSEVTVRQRWTDRTLVRLLSLVQCMWECRRQ